MNTGVVSFCWFVPFRCRVETRLKPPQKRVRPPADHSSKYKRVVTMMASSHGIEDTSSGTTVKFVPFQSAVESAFWVRYNRAKLETIKLSETAVPIQLSYSVNGGSRVQCRDNSLLVSENDEAAVAAGNNNNNECVAVTGSLLGFNTMEAFQKTDKNKLLRDYFCAQFWHEDDAKVLNSLNCSMLITLADLKQHKVVYWFAFPVLAPKQSITIQSQEDVSGALATQLAGSGETMRRRHPLTEGLTPYFMFSKQKTVCEPLSKESYNSMKTDNDDLVFCFFDPVGHAGDDAMMGWPMRNLVAYLCFHLDLGGKSVQILSYRPKVLRRISELHDSDDSAVLVEPPTGSDDKCLLLELQVPLKQDYEHTIATASAADKSASYQNYKVVGWELNARAKPGPRSVNLKPLLDPTHLAIQAADLNLKLMKWRMIPNLNVDLLQSSKVLLIGAGTLGCNVARVLLGWGIRHFKIVDYGKVSYSNPVRQSLFTLEDCHADGGSGRPKAAAAAEALKTIAADVHSEGISISVPMPGHPESEESIRNSVELLDKLVQDADVVFLLTDTRESRWLPTVMAAAHDKMLINAALGLDSWLVMRHGGGFATDSKEAPRHGCYFCSDVVAPENSTKNRTLDQQCTVTRPGLALIAGSMASEVMVSMLHHPAGVNAPAPSSMSSNFSPTVAQNDAASPLGLIPHQIRGSLVSYTMMTPTVPAFKHCTGCSKGVVDEYLKDKIGVVLKCCQTTSSSYLEDIAGLTHFRAEAAEKLVGMGDWDEDELSD